jgi:hypothetical protein
MGTNFPGNIIKHCKDFVLAILKSPILVGGEGNSSVQECSPLEKTSMAFRGLDASVFSWQYSGCCPL